MTIQTATAEYALVAVDHVHPHPRNVRREVTGVEELAESIKAGGLHQPLVVAANNPDDDHDGYTLVMGHRRLAAAQALGWSEVPCVIRHDLSTEVQVLEAMLAENMARTDLTVIEEGDAVQALMDLDVKPAKIAKAIGRTAKHVKDRAQIAACLTEKARRAVDDGQITITDALHLTKLDGDIDHESAEDVERSIGTPNFRYTLERALARAEFNRKRATILAELEAAGATITDGPQPAGDDEVRLFLAGRPDNPADPTVYVYVAEFKPWTDNITPLVQWVQTRPRVDEDPEGGTVYVSGDGDTADAVLAANRAAQRADWEKRRDAECQARQDRETAQATRERWLHEKWREGMHAGPGVRDRQLRDLIQVRGEGYSLPDGADLSPIVAGPGAALEVDDPALDPAGWPLDKQLFAAWWIHIGHGRDQDATHVSTAWDETTVGYLQGLVDDYDYPLSDVEEALMREYEAFHADADPEDG